MVVVLLCLFVCSLDNSQTLKEGSGECGGSVHGGVRTDKGLCNDI